MGKPPTAGQSNNSSKSRSPKTKTKTATGGNRKASTAKGGGSGAPKRSRPAGGRDAKRARTEAAGGGGGASSKLGTPRASAPGSPSSSRSRPRKAGNVAGAAGAAAPVGAGADAGAGATAAGGGKPPAAKPRAAAMRQMASRNTLSQQANVNLLLEGMPVVADIKATNVVRRLFGQEIQCVMHSFGETRAASRNTLELVEDAVRTAVRRVIAEAAAFATLSEEAAGAGAAGVGPVLLEVRHVAHIIRRDPRAMYRFNQTIRLAADQYGERNEAVELRKYCRNKAAPRPWESIAALADLGDGTAEASERQFMQDPWKYCTWKAYHIFRQLMPGPTFNDYVKCRSTNLVTGVSRSQWSKITDQPRFLMFQRWLDLGSEDDVKISLGALYALGHVAWECIGVLTQTALIQAHFDDVQAGNAEFRCQGWSYARHLLAALGHGIATAVLVPLTDTQLLYLRQEVERLPMLSVMGSEYWKGSKPTACRALEPKHIREALRRTNQFEDSVLLSIMRGTYASDSCW